MSALRTIEAAMVARLSDTNVHVQLLNNGPMRQAVVSREGVTIASGVWSLTEEATVRDLARILGVPL